MATRILRYRTIAIVILSAFCIGVRWPLFAAPVPQKKTAKEQDKLFTGPPFTVEAILKLVDVYPDRLIQAITKRGLSFVATPENVEALRKGGASEKLIEAIARRAPYKPAPSERPRIVPPTGGNLVVKCAPAECGIRIDGVPGGTTTNGSLEIKNLPPKEVAVDFEKDGYIGVQKTVTILQSAEVFTEAQLEPSDATKAQLGSELTASMAQALGGEQGLADVTSLYASGAAVLWNTAGQRSDWTLKTLLKLPNMVLFDLEGSDAKFWVSLVGDKYKSGGDRNKLVGVLGGGADKDRGEFDTTLRLYRDYQIAALVNRIRSAAFRVLANSLDQDDKEQFHLRALGNTETYELTLDHDKLPTFLKVESQLGLGTGVEFAYSDYKDAGKGKYPSTIEIKLADGDHHGIEVRLEKLTIAADLKEKDFNGRVKPRK